MKKNYLILFFLFFLFSTLQSQQKIEIKGKVIDQENNKSISDATIQLFQLPDTTFIRGIITSDDGSFSIMALDSLSYLIKSTYVGYKSKWEKVPKSSKKIVNLKPIVLKSDVIHLQTAVVVAKLPPVTTKEDTVLYNVESYRLPKSFVLEELVKKLPGADVDKDGNITINGKKIERILVDGKNFFTKDPKLALRNLPIDMIEKLKVYEKKSDHAEKTGVEDGEEQTVLDLSVKKEMKKGFFSNADLAMGSNQKYMGKAFVSRFVGDSYGNLIVDKNNVSNRSFFSPGFNNSNANRSERKTVEGGANLYTKSDKLETSSSVSVSEDQNDSKIDMRSETFLTDKSNYGFSRSQSLDKSKNANANFKLEWTPDTLNTLIFKPSFSVSQSKGMDFRKSIASLFEYHNDFIYDLDRMDPLVESKDLINQRIVNSFQEGSHFNFQGEVDYIHKFKKKGRNLSVNLDYNMDFGDNDNNSLSQINYYLQHKDTLINQRFLSENKSSKYKIRIAYCEPVYRSNYLQFKYTYSHNYSTSDRTTYQRKDFQEIVVDSLSRNYENQYYIHNISFSFKSVKPKYYYSLGIDLQPQRSVSFYQKGENDYDLSRNIFNYSPSLSLRYKIHRHSALKFSYRGRTSQPSVMQLMPITDYSNPLVIRSGNPELKPTYTHYMNFSYNSFNVKKKNSIMFYLNYTNTINRVSNRISYDETTGVRHIIPENINGNWSSMFTLIYNTPLKNKKFSISTNTNMFLGNMVSYIKEIKEPVKNTTRSIRCVQMLQGKYTNKWMQNILTIGGRINNITNDLSQSQNRKTYDYKIGFNTTLNLPLDITLVQDLNYSIYNGYSADLDRKVCLLNFMISKSFLSKKQATIRLECMDLLHQQSNLSRRVTSNMRSDVEYYAVNSYILFHFIYRLNSFG